MHILSIVASEYCNAIFPIIIFIVFPILNKVRKLFFIQRILVHKGVLFLHIAIQFRELL